MKADDAKLPWENSQQLAISTATLAPGLSTWEYVVRNRPRRSAPVTVNLPRCLCCLATRLAGMGHPPPAALGLFGFEHDPLALDQQIASPPKNKY
jgi:hypothetical protein